MAELDKLIKDMEKSGKLYEQSDTTTVNAPQVDTDAALREIELQEKYGDRPLAAAGLGLARGVTAGLSDVPAAAILGQESVREIQERNPAISGLTEVGGLVGSALATGGTSAAAQGVSRTAGLGVRAATTAGTAIEQAAAKALGTAAEKSVAKRIVKNMGAKAAGSAVEGSLLATGMLVSEDALGRAELNAENLAATMGMGALWGGAAGAAIGGVGAAVPAVSRKISDIGKRGLAKVPAFSDPDYAYLMLTGHTPAQARKILDSRRYIAAEGRKLLTSHPEFKLASSDEDIARILGSYKQEAQEGIERVIPLIDEAATKLPEDVRMTRGQTYRMLSEKLENDLVKPLSRSPANDSDVAYIRREIRNLMKRAADDTPVTAAELQTLRRSYDDKVRDWFKTRGEAPIKEKVARQMRGYLSDELDTLATQMDAVDSSLANQLRTYNKQYHITADVSKKATSKVDKAQLYSMKDLLLGSMAGGVGAVTDMVSLAVGTAAVPKLLESDIARKASILYHMERANKQVESRIVKGIKSFFEGAKKSAKPASMGVIFQSDLAKPESGKKPKSGPEAVENIRKNVIELQSDFDRQTRRMGIATMRVNQVAPNTAIAMAQTMMRGISFLQDKLPKGAARQGLLESMRAPSYSTMDLAKFERYMKAVEEPMSVVEDLQSGIISREGVEALRYVYPELYSLMQQEAMKYIVQYADKLPFQKRMQLGILLDIPADTTLLPGNIAALQSTWAPQEQSQTSPSQPPGMKAAVGNVETAHREQGSSEAFLNRRMES